MSPEERAHRLAKALAHDWQAIGEVDASLLVDAIGAAEQDAAADLEFYREREKHIAKLLGVADGGQYRADWDGAVERLKREAADEALERAGEACDRIYLPTAANVVRSLKSRSPSSTEGR
jgi:2-polyprenyl-6-methoxyphenol hydroxylase-like FAD-dependent oxidoreductase